MRWSGAAGRADLPAGGGVQTLACALAAVSQPLLDEAPSCTELWFPYPTVAAAVDACDARSGRP